jgi:hypothetical protein
MISSSGKAEAPAGIDFPALRDPRYPIHGKAEILEPYLRAILERVHPERIILFGSYAYGTPTEHSDFDLLVVRKEIASSKASNMELRLAIWGVDAPPASFTFLSQTPEGLAERPVTAIPLTGLLSPRSGCVAPIFSGKAKA